MKSQAFVCSNVLLKMLVILVWVYPSLVLHSQEINVGISNGLYFLESNTYYSLGGNFEYKPKNAIISINTDPFVIFRKSEVSLTEPIYLKFIIGRKFRVSPAFGGFFRTTGSYGWLLGLHLEYVIKDKFIVFSKDEYYKDFWKDEYPNHFGGSSTYINSEHSMLFSLGLKMMLIE
jgi:hypothetical protein